MAVSKKSIALIAGGVGLVTLVAGAGVVMASGGWHGHHGMGHGDMRAHMERMVTEIDTDADGSLTRAEVDAYRTMRFAAMDSDGDGEITPKEKSDGMRAMRFARLDADSDGMISQAEFMAANTGHRWGGKGFSRMDDDGNGRLSSAEMSKMTERMFGHLDDNGDGVVGADELQSMRDRHQQ